MRTSLVRSCTLLVAVAAVVLVIGLVGRPLGEGSESIGNGYYTLDTGSEIRLGFRDADGSMNPPFDADVRSFQRRGDAIYVARWPLKTVEVDNHLEGVYEGGGCQYWRIETRTHEAVRTTKADAKVDC